MKRAVVALGVVAALAAPARAEPAAMEPSARARFESGLRAYQNRNYRDAIAELRAGYAIDPHPDFLFPWAQATRLSGDCAGALPLYRRALDAATSQVDRRDIEQLIARCETEVESAEPERPPPVVEAEPVGPVAAVRTEAPVRAPSAWYTDCWGGALAIGGALGLAAGAGLFIAAGRAGSDADSAATLDGFVDKSNLADQRRTFGVIALGAGAGLAAVATLRYAWVARRSAREMSVAVAPAADGAALFVRGRF